MVKASLFKNILVWLKLFTYISATVLLIINNNFDKLTYFIPLVMLLFFIDYSREYYLVAGKKPIRYILASIKSYAPGAKTRISRGYYMFV